MLSNSSFNLKSLQMKIAIWNRGKSAAPCDDNGRIWIKRLPGHPRSELRPMPHAAEPKVRLHRNQCLQLAASSFGQLNVGRPVWFGKGLEGGLGTHSIAVIEVLRRPNCRDGRQKSQQYCR